MQDDEDRTALRLIPALDSSHDTLAFRTVTDADEEIFYLYTISAAKADRRGLGQVDNNNDLLQVTVHLTDVEKETEVHSIHSIDEEVRPVSNRAKSVTTKASKNKSQAITKRKNADTLQVVVRQDSTSLRSTGGDTGSVIWRSSIYFAEKLLRDLCEADGGRKRHSSEPVNCIFSSTGLMSCRILELGSGTGILPALVLSHSYLESTNHSLQWLATDQANMLSLLRKNLSSFSRAHVEALDWMDCSSIYQTQNKNAIETFLKDMLEPINRNAGDENSKVYPDLIIATDCIFNPHLFAPFVDTLNLFSAPFKTIAVVVCELREAEAMTEFLQTWLRTGKKGEQWSIQTLEGSLVLGKALEKGSVVWAAWRLC